MKTLIQISDTHFGTERPPVVEALVRFVRDQAPGLIILSGDITQRARRSQFRAARAFLDRLGDVPMLVIPGNHDIPLFNPAARIFWPYRNYRRELGGNLEPEFESEDVLAIALNTTCAGSTIFLPKEFSITSRITNCYKWLWQPPPQHQIYPYRPEILLSPGHIWPVNWRDGIRFRVAIIAWTTGKAFPYGVSIILIQDACADALNKASTRYSRREIFNT